MNKIVIAFSRPSKLKITNLHSELIMWWQGGTSYSHTLFIFESLLYGKTLVAQASHGKVHFIELDNFLKDNIITRRFFVVANDGVLENVVRYCIENLQKPYGIFQIIKIGLMRIFKIKLKDNGSRSFICSELIARAMPDVFNASDLITPLDIEKKLVELSCANQ